MTKKEWVENSFEPVRNKVETRKQKGKETHQIIKVATLTLIWVIQGRLVQNRGI